MDAPVTGPTGTTGTILLLPVQNTAMTRKQVLAVFLTLLMFGSSVVYTISIL
ncbi:hypothetical protein [Halobacterium zhouii]|uniref:hypothetical protein n=1 Tax=Halobacterium zhouii TaxID=2902624 RepID=UPI001E49116E|nr:hypothetical protein [Halobacterium zhouii]